MYLKNQTDGFNQTSFLQTDKFFALSPALPLAVFKVCDIHTQTYTQLQRKEFRKFKATSS